jgi:malonate transporter and related proteins
VNGVLEGFAVIAVVVGVGYVVGRTGVLGEGAVEVLSRTAFFVATPALLFVILAGANVRAVFSAGLVVTAATSTVVCLL